MNFSATYKGGGIRRLIETAKWLDKSQGGIFIVNTNSYQFIKEFTVNNKFILIDISKLNRLFKDGLYLHNIIKDIGIPDVYYSYGIPIKYQVGKINWFHITNALSLNTYKIDIPILLRLKMKL